MTKSTTFCDICGRQKGVTNHWFAAMPASGNLTFSYCQFESRYQKDICSEKCAHDALSQWLQERTKPTEGKFNLEKEDASCKSGVEISGAASVAPASGGTE